MTLNPSFIDFAIRLNEAFDLCHVKPLHRPAVISEACEVSLLTAIRYLDGKTRPKFGSVWLKLASAAQTDAWWLFDGTGNAVHAHNKYLLSCLPWGDQVRVRRFFIAINNGSKKAAALRTRLPLTEAALRYESDIKRRSTAGLTV